VDGEVDVKLRGTILSKPRAQKWMLKKDDNVSNPNHLKIVASSKM
jgi:hypothetical protein